jgi:hypothetical protein
MSALSNFEGGCFSFALENNYKTNITETAKFTQKKKHLNTLIS